MKIELSGRLSGVGHDVGDVVWQSRWHPNGSIVASCGIDRKLCVWKVQSNKQEPSSELLTKLSSQHTKSIRSLCWSPTGKFLISGSFDGTAAIWTKVEDDFECVFCLEGHENEIKGVTWTSCGQFIATCSRDKTVWIWEVLEEDDYECAEVLTAHTQDVKFVQFHPQELVLISGGYDDTVRLYCNDEAEDGWHCFQTIKTHTSTVWNGSFNVTGNRFCTCSADKTVRIFDRGSQMTSSPKREYKLTHTISGQHDNDIFDVSWCKQTSLIATACGDNYVRVFQEFPSETNEGDASTSFQLACKYDCGCEVNSVHWNPLVKGSLLAALDSGESITLTTIFESDDVILFEEID